MNERVPQYRAYLVFPRETGLDDHLSVGEHSVEFHGGIVRGHVLLARKMLAAGSPDGELLVTTSTHKAGSQPTNHGLLSVLASRSEMVVSLSKTVQAESEHTPNSAQQIKLSSNARENLETIADNPASWATIAGRSRGFLRANGLVEVAKDKAFLTPLAEDLLAVPAEAEDQISAVQRAALDLCPMPSEEWNSKVHHLCRKALRDRGWVSEKNGVVSALTYEEIRSLAS